MFLFTYTGFFLAALCLGFSFFILFKKRNDFLARYFSYHVIAVAVWIGSNAFADIARTPGSLIFWSGLAFIAVSFFISYYLCFMYIFIHKRRPSELLMLTYFLPSIIFSLGAFSKYSVVETIFPANAPTQIVPGIFYTHHLYFFIISVLYSTFELTRFLIFKARQQERRQALFMESGFLILFAATIFFGIILPVNLGELRFFNVGPQFSIILILLSSYAILRHRLFDIELIIKKGAVFSVLFLLVLFIFNGLVAVFTEFIPGLVSRVLAALIITLIFSPLKNWLEDLTDKVFFRKHYQFDAAINELNHILLRLPKLDDLAKSLLGYLKQILKIDKAAILIINEQGSFETRYLIGKKRKMVNLAANSALLGFLMPRVNFEDGHTSMIIEKQDLEYRIVYEVLDPNHLSRLLAIKNELEEFGYAAVAPLFNNGKMLGLVFLGEKLSGDRYSNLDFRFLDVFSHEASFAVENALNFERIFRLDELKSEFVRVVSHQLLTPLVAARWNIELVLKGAIEKIKSRMVKGMIGDAQINLARLNDGLNNFLTVLAIAEEKISLKKETVDLVADVINPVIKNLEGDMSGKKMKLILNKGRGEIRVCLDAEKTKKIIAVLVSNAITYGPVNSRIKMDVKYDQGVLSVTVEDQGIGVAKKNRREIFAKFFRGEEAKKISPDGLGINLYIARDFVTRHGGRLWVEDKLDGTPGARFVFTIPAK